MSVDERLLQYCRTEAQTMAVRATIEHETQRKAADAMGWSLSNLEKHLKNIRSNAREKGDFHLPLTGQSHIVRDDEGRFVRWDKTNIDRAKIVPLYESMQAGIDVRIRRPKSPPKVETDELCAVLPLADCHFGMLAYEKETGSSDYDLEIASSLVLGAVKSLVKQSPKTKDAYLVNLGDFLHYDGMVAKTPQSGNILDTDSRYGKVVEQATAVYIACVDMMLQKYENVTLLNSRGNHDESSGIWLNILCKYTFRDEPRVKVLDNHNKLIPFQWGNNLVVTHHGDGVNHRKLHEAITRDFRREHGQANYTLSMNGHLHNETVTNIGGVRFETFSVLTPPDAWHASKLYGSEREMSLFLLRKNGGIKRRYFENPGLDLADYAEAA